MTVAPFEIARGDRIDGLGKGLRVIESFDDEHPRQTASEVAVRADLTRTAARRYLLSLAHFGYADTDGKHFWLTPRVLRLGQSFLDAARLPRLVQPFIQRVAMQTGETVNVSVLDGHEIVYIARSGSPRIISIGYQPGARVPAHVVTPGLVVLAQFEDSALIDWIAAHDFCAFTPRSVTDPAVFKERVRATRALGYGLAEGQLEPGLRGVAVALQNRRGQCVGAVSTTVPVVPLTSDQTVARFVPLLQECAQALRLLL